MFTLMRHGEADYGLAEARRLKGGARDWVPLTPRGVAQAEEAAERLLGRGITLVLTSPMTRALQTGAAVSRRLQVHLTVELDLHEWLPDLTFAYDNSALATAHGREAEACGGEWPAGEQRPWEPFSRVRERSGQVLRRYRDRGHVLVVCHGTLIFTLTGVRLGAAEFIGYQISDSLVPPLE